MTITEGKPPKATQGLWELTAKWQKIDDHNNACPVPDLCCHQHCANELEALLPALDAAIREGQTQPTESMEEIAKLANFIMENIDGDPSCSESAVDVAIRLLKRTAQPSDSELGNLKTARDEWSTAALDRLLDAMTADKVADRILEMFPPKIEAFPTGEPSPAELARTKLIELIEAHTQQAVTQARVDAMRQVAQVVWEYDSLDEKTPYDEGHREFNKKYGECDIYPVVARMIAALKRDLAAIAKEPK